MGHGAHNLCTDVPRVSIMALSACIVLWVPSAWGQVGTIAAAGTAGLLLFKPRQIAEHDPLPITVSRRAGVAWLSLFFALLIGLPVLAQLLPSQAVAMVDAFYRAGSLVFGGGHVVLPLLQAEVVPPPVGSAMKLSWPVMVPRRRCLVPYSRLLRSWVSR